MNKEDIEKLQICREAIDEHQKVHAKGFESDADHAKAVEEYMKVLNDNGFATVSDFTDFNDAMNFEIYKEATIISGECDGCVGLPVPECVRIYGQANACSNTRPKVALDTIYRIAYKAKVTEKVVVKDGKSHFCCPEGHGFYVDETKRKPFKKWSM
jgi:hypothetical protein